MVLGIKDKEIKKLYFFYQKWKPTNHKMNTEYPYPGYVQHKS